MSQVLHQKSSADMLNQLAGVTPLHSSRHLTK